MNCPGCGRTNRDGARFCIGCGAALALRCASCGSELPPEARFCDGCGSPVTSEPAAEPVAAARKVVTVVFADMTGSTTLEEGMDAEAVRSLLDRIYAELRKDVEGHGGRVVKFTGDGLMAAFGVPEVGEDDADRAVAAATAMRETMARIASETGQPIALKAGVNTGEVVVIEEDDDVVGDAVNISSRLEGAAASGEVLVGETTWRLTRATSSFEAIEPLRVKGKSEPVAAYRLLSVAEEPEETLALPFVGREAELDQLLAVYDEVVEANAARLVTIVGSPGLGKTRLAHELAARLADRAVVRESRCDPAGSATFAPIAETIRASASIPEAATEEEILEALKAMLPEDDVDRDRIAAFVGALLGAGKPGSTEQTFWALRKLIETRAADDLPRVLILDDLQWAEPLLLDLVEHLAEWIRDAPVLLVGTGRPELRDIRPSLVEGGRAAAVIALEGLDADATEELAMGLLGTEHVPTELIARIPSSTEGNPLFVRELVRMLVDDGVLRREGDAWHLTVDVEAVEVPPTIQSLLAALMDRLDANERTVLELASVVGKEFYRGAVAELATTGVREVLEGCLERLRRKDLVEPVGTYWIDEPIYRFHHALIRDAAYRRLLKETRAELHERVASWVEAKTSGLVGEHEELIGYHLEQAHAYKRQLGREDHELGRRAGDLLRTAAQRALDRDDLPGAAALAGRALERLPSFEADGRTDLLLMRCEALLSMGDVTHAGPAVEEFLELAHEPRLAAWGTCFQGHLANLTSGGLEETEASVAAAAEQLTELGDMAGAAKAHTVRATALAGLGRFGECEAVLDEALTAARQAEGRRRSVTATLGTAPQAQVWGPNPVSRAGGRCLDLVRLLRITTGSLAVEQTSMRCQAVLEAMRGRADAARGMLRRARRALTELGLEHELLETEQYAGLVELVDGEAEAAREHLSIAHEGFRRLGSRVLGAQTAALLARAHIQLGEDAQAEALVEMAAQLASQDVKTAIAWRSVKAEILVRRGELDEARALAEEAVRLGEPTDALLDHGMAYRQLARVLRAAGDTAGAQSAEERASALFERKGATALLEVEPRPATTEVDRGAASEEVAATPAAGLDNAAVRASLAFVDTLFAKRDLAAFEALLTEDFAIDDRRRALVAASSTGREAAVEEAKSVLGIGTTRMERTPIAIRGERLCLLRDLTLGEDVGSEGFGVEFLSIMELDEGGLLTRWTRFEPDDFRAAMEELDDRFVAGEGEPHADAMALARAVLRAQNDRDWDAYRNTFTDDLVQIDHRPVSLGDTITGADEHVRSIRQLTELIPGLFFWIAAIHRLERGRSLVRFGMRGATEDGGEVDLSLLNVYGFGDKISRMENFHVDQFEEALARFEQLGESTPEVGDIPENDAVRAALLMYEAFERQDWDAFGALHRLDGTTEDRRPGLGSRGSGRDHMVEIGRTTKSVGPRTARWSTIAVRGSRLAVGRVAFRAGPDDFEVDVLQLFETDEEGLVHHWVTWEPDAIDAALAELNARFLADEGKPAAVVARLWVDFVRSYNDRDWDALRALFRDDMGFVDHRPLSLGEIHDPDEYLHALEQLVELIPGRQCYLTGFPALRSDVGLCSLHVPGTTPDGGETEDSMHLLGVLSGGRFERIEHFPGDKLDTALARFEELSTAAPTGHPERLETASTTRELENEASRAALRDLDLATAGRWDELAELLGPDHVRIDRRQGLGSAGGRDDVIEGWKAAVELGTSQHDMRVIATRGDRLALLAGTASGTHGFEVVATFVAETDADGRLVRVVLLDEDAYDAAFAELDGRFAAGEGAPFADVVETNATVFALWNARDFQAATTHIDPDFVLVDHRPLGFGTVEGVEPFMEVANSLAEVAPRARRYFSRYDALADGVALVEQVSRASPDPDSDEIVYQFVVCVENGRWRRGEVFPEDELDAALARFEELSSGALPLGPPENTCLRVLREGSDRFLARDWDGLAALYADDHVLEDRRRLVSETTITGREALTGYSKGGADVGAATATLTPLATRGDWLALVRLAYRSADPEQIFELVFLEVAELDEQDLVGSTVMFEEDDLDAAITELDGRFAAGEGAPFADEFLITSQLVRAVNARDWSAVRACLTDDYVLSDRRPASFGGLTAEQWIDSLRALADIAPDSAVYSVAFRAMDRGRAWGLNRVSASRSDPTDTYSLFNMVGQVRDGKLARGWVFPPEDFGAARACYEALSELAPAGELRNAAMELLERANDAFNRGDSETFASLLAEDAVHEDRRKGIGHVLTGRDKLVENFEAIHELGSATRSFTPLAIRGDRLVLSRTRYADTDGTNEAEMLRINYLDDQGRFGGSIDFDPDALDAAITELDERYAAGEGASGGGVVRLCSRFIHILNLRDWPRVRATLADDFVLVDHRPASLGTQTADSWIESLRVLTDLAPDLRANFVRYNALGPGGCVVDNLWRGPTPDQGIVEIANLVLTQIRDDTITGIEVFPADQIDEALARFEELPPGPSRLANACSEANDRVTAAFAARDWEAVAKAVAPDAYVEDRRPGLRNVVEGREAIVANLRELAEVGGAAWEEELLATRGDRLVLYRRSLVGPADRDIDVRILDLSGIDEEGRIAFGIHFEADDLDAAFAELDERYFSGEGRLQAEAWPPFAAIGDGLNARDWAGLRAGFADDCEFVDHRPASLGHVSSPEEQLEATRTLVELVPDARWTNTDILHLEERIALMRVVMTGTNEGGGSVEIGFLCVVQVNDGLRTRMELFAEDQLEMARARLDELRRSDPLPSSLENSATRFVRRLKGTFDRRDVQAFIGLHTEDFCHDDRRAGLHHVTHGTDEIIEYVRNQWELGGSTFANEVIAIRGDLLVLSRRVYEDAEGLYEIEQLIVDEVRPDGRVAYATVFDPGDLDAAFAELDERFLSGEGAPYADVLRHGARQRAAVVAGDWDTWRDLIDEDVVLVDHRSPSLGEVRGVEDVLEASRTLAGLVRDARPRVVAYHDLAADRTLIEVLLSGTADHGGEVELSYLRLQQVCDGRVVRIELFPLDALDAARARFSELSRI